MQKVKIYYSESDLPAVSLRVRQIASDCHIFLFSGNLGAGKTTLIRALLRSYGINDVVTSPTFTYVNCYKSDTLKLYHFDLYRLSSVDEFLQAGFDEYLYQEKSIVFIEWSDSIMPILHGNVCFIDIFYKEIDERFLTCLVKHL